MARTIIRNWKAFENVDMSTSQESQISDCAFMDKGRIYAYWEGATSGTGKLYIEISNDKKLWRRINPSGMSITAPEGTLDYSMQNMDFNYLILYFDSGTESTGTLSVQVNASAVGV